MEKAKDLRFGYSHDDATIILIGLFDFPFGILFVGIVIYNILLFLESDRPKTAKTFHSWVVMVLYFSLTEHSLRLSLKPPSFLISWYLVLFIIFIGESKVY